MPDEKEPIEEQPQLPAMMILKQIQEGIIDKETLPKEMRQACVEYLLSKITPISKIAFILAKDERTIKRDKKEIAQRNAQKPSIDYSLQLIEELMTKASATQEQLMELANDKEGSVQEKGQAAFFLWKAIQEQMKLLQSLGYLPEQPMKIEASITQEIVRDVTKLKEGLAEAEAAAIRKGRINEPAVAGFIKAIRQEIAIAEANNNMDELNKLLAPPQKDEGASRDAGGQ